MKLTKHEAILAAHVPCFAVDPSVELFFSTYSLQIIMSSS